MVCPPTMTADTYSFDIAKSVLAISIVMFQVDWGSREKKTASHAGAVESDDLQATLPCMAALPPEYLPAHRQWQISAKQSAASLALSQTPPRTAEA